MVFSRAPYNLCSKWDENLLDNIIHVLNVILKLKLFIYFNGANNFSTNIPCSFNQPISDKPTVEKENNSHITVSVLWPNLFVYSIILFVQAGFSPKYIWYLIFHPFLPSIYICEDRHPSNITDHSLGTLSTVVLVCVKYRTSQASPPSI